jgi:hypothetical protein
MVLIEGDIQFTIQDTTHWWKPDAENHSGLKAVDFIIETDSHYLFLELKDANHPRATQQAQDDFFEKYRSKQLVFDLSQKLKDTVLYRWACNQLYNKPVKYIVILEFHRIDDAMRGPLGDSIKGSLPLLLEEEACVQKQIISSFELLDLQRWNRFYAQYPAIRLSAAAGGV